MSTLTIENCREVDPAAKQRPNFSALAMDSELVVYILGMFHDKFRTNSKSKGFNPLGESCSAGQATFSPFAAYVKAIRWALGKYDLRYR